MTKNTNYLVYVHLRKKQLEQNSCQTSRMTKNTNDLVMFIFIWLKLISLTCNCWKRKLPNDLKKLKLPQWPVKNWTFFISYRTPSNLSEAFVDSFNRNCNQRKIKRKITKWPEKTQITPMTRSKMDIFHLLSNHIYRKWKQLLLPSWTWVPADLERTVDRPSCTRRERPLSWV